MGGLSDVAPEPLQRGSERMARDFDDVTRLARCAELEELYRSRHPQFAGFFVRAGLSKAVAHDLTHDTFVAALVNLSQFKGESMMFTWVWRIAINMLNKHLRSPAQREDAVGGAEDVHALVLPPLTEGADAALSTGRQQNCVRRQFSRFTREHPERAMALSMAEIQGASREELANWLGRSMGATREYLSQCRKILGQYLECCRDC